MKNLELTCDAEGKELLLKEGKFQVMMEWEKPYMQACIDALQPFGDVLEIGFGCGYSATAIQSYHPKSPKSHTIIECDPTIAELARQFAKVHPNVKIIENTWQEALDALPIYDTIFFDDYPLESEAQMQKMQEGAVASHAVLEQGRHTLAEFQSEIAPHLPKSYRDEDLLEFFELLTTDGEMEPKNLLIFFEDLKRNQQITEKQQAFVLELSLSKGLITQADLDAFVPKTQSPFSFEEKGNRLFEFLSLALKKHMRKGSRFSCFLEDPTSKFENKQFFEQIITNPYLDYTEQWIDIEVPAHCKYYRGNTALVITITKMAD